MFRRLAKHLEFRQNTPLRVVFSTLVSLFGYPDETLSHVFDIFTSAAKSHLLHCRSSFRIAESRIRKVKRTWEPLTFTPPQVNVLHPRDLYSAPGTCTPPQGLALRPRDLYSAPGTCTPPQPGERDIETHVRSPPRRVLCR